MSQDPPEASPQGQLHGVSVSPSASPQGQLHGVSVSPFVRKVRAALGLKGIDYELVNVMPGAMDPEFRAKSPLSKIPVWQEGDWTLPDSSAICAYLERIRPEPALYPESPRAFAEILFWEEYADTRLVQSAAPVFYQRIVRAHLFDESPDEEIVRRHLEEVLPPVFDQLESLCVDRLSAADPALTVAHLAVWSPFVNLLHADYAPDRASWPGLVRLLEAIGEHAPLRRLVEEERSALASA